MLLHTPLTMVLHQGIEAIISCEPSLRLGAAYTMQNEGLRPGRKPSFCIVLTNFLQNQKYICYIC
jgi:hypothetical protein